LAKSIALWGDRAFPVGQDDPNKTLDTAMTSDAIKSLFT
jgi:hypothetical protein